MAESSVCRSCSAPNEAGRDICWQCFKPLAGGAPRSHARRSYSSEPVRSDPEREPVSIVKEVSGELITKVLTAVFSGLMLAGWHSWFGPSRQSLAHAADIKREASMFAIGRSSQECLTEALSRDGNCKDLACHLDVDAFYAETLKTASRPPRWCFDMPPTIDVLNSSIWQVRQCKALGLNGTYCGALFKEIQKDCEQRPG